MNKFEIAISDETKEVMKALITENEQLKKELAYFQAWLLSGDGKICSCCEKVRHVDDMIIARDVHGDEIEGLFCSPECACRAAREHHEDVEDLAAKNYEFDNR